MGYLRRGAFVTSSPSPLASSKTAKWRKGRTVPSPRSKGTGAHETARRAGRPPFRSVRTRPSATGLAESGFRCAPSDRLPQGPGAGPAPSSLSCDPRSFLSAIRHARAEGASFSGAPRNLPLDPYLLSAIGCVRVLPRFRASGTLPAAA